MSCISAVVHVDAFCDLNKTPAYGCLDILSPVKSSLPISDNHTLYSTEDVNRAKQYSVLSKR